MDISVKALNCKKHIEKFDSTTLINKQLFNQGLLSFVFVSNNFPWLAQFLQLKFYAKSEPGKY